MEFKKKPKVIIFDFDGTIANIAEFQLNLLDEGVEKFNIEKPTSEDIERFRGMRIPQIFKAMKVPIWKLPMIIRWGRNKMTEVIHTLKPFDGMDELLSTLDKAGYKIYILTSNSKDNVEIFLNNHDLRKYFDEVHSEFNLFSKARKIKSFMTKHKWEKEDVLYIGDEVRDVDACKSIGIPIISVTWGLNSKELLKENNPGFLVDTPEQIIQALDK